MFFTLSTALSTVNIMFTFWHSDLPLPKARPDYSCGEVKWIDGPAVHSGEFDGTVQVACKFTSSAGGGFDGLAEELNEATLQVDEVHEGPIAIDVEGVPGNRYDITSQVKPDLKIRGNRILATDGLTILYDRFGSTEVWGDGDLAYLNTVHSNLMIVPLTRNKYKVVIEYRTRVDKPWFAPVGVFKKECANAMVEEVESSLEPTINAISEHL